MTDHDPEDARTIAGQVCPGLTGEPLPHREPGRALDALMAVSPAPREFLFHIRVPRSLTEAEVTELWDAGVPRAWVALSDHSALIRAQVSAFTREDAIAALMRRLRPVLGRDVILEDHSDG
jgi:hypothetical protein